MIPKAMNAISPTSSSRPLAQTVLRWPFCAMRTTRKSRQDEIGTPFCLTYDFESETDGCVTIRDRDTMQQERVSIDKLVEYLEAKIEF